jgi:RES domain-containing protein
VYCAPNPATALLEVLVHAEIDLDDVPASYRYLEIEVPDAVPVDILDTRALPPNWASNAAATRASGDEWLESRRTAVLAVPSVIVPETRNYLINPEHPGAAAIQIIRTYTHPFDPRLAL